MVELEKPKTYAIRIVTVIDKGLKTKAKRPTLITESLNEGEKFPFRLNSKEELEAFPLGKELRIRLEEVPTHLLDEVQKSSPLLLPPVAKIECPRGVLPDEYGLAEVCLGCDHLNDSVCDLTTQENP